MRKTEESIDDKRTIVFYSDLLAKHGVDPRSLNWGGQQSQELRFSILTQIGLMSGDSLLDVGCGLGDYLCWLNRHGVDVDYCGIDLTPNMVKKAQERLPGINFEVGNLLKCDHSLSDFVVASGIFYLRNNEPEAYLQTMVTRMYALCRKGVAFNSLSVWAPQQDEREYYADPLRVIAFCRTLTPWVVLRHDYHIGDFTVYLHRGAIQQ